MRVLPVTCKFCSPTLVGERNLTKEGKALPSLPSASPFSVKGRWGGLPPRRGMLQEEKQSFFFLRQIPLAAHCRERHFAAKPQNRRICTACTNRQHPSSAGRKTKLFLPAANSQTAKAPHPQREGEPLCFIYTVRSFTMRSMYAQTPGKLSCTALFGMRSTRRLNCSRYCVRMASFFALSCSKCCEPSSSITSFALAE